MQRAFLCRLLAAVLSLVAASNLSAQGTAISYQGRLSASGTLANTNFDFRFAVFNASTNGTQVSYWVTNFTVPVSNGLFSVALDFGPGVFNGTPNGSNDWLDVSVRATGASSFTTLAPRQPILPVPYALFANSASNLLGSLPASQVVGTIASASISGTYTNAVNFTNGINGFTGTFTGNGANLTNLNAAQMTGTVASASISGTYSNVVNFINRTNTFFGTFTGNGGGLTNVNGSGIVGIIASGQISGTYANAVNFSAATNTFNGSFSGDGANLTNLNASQVSSGTLADARLSANAALHNANQTFTGVNTFTGDVNSSATNTFTGPNIFNGTNTFNSAGIYTSSNNFSGANTFSAWGNSFTGSFFGNGLVGWNAVAGITQQAARDNGYLLTNAALTTVTLPVAGSLTNGDIVRISGAGPGGWLAAQNSGQTAVGNFACYRNSFVVAMLGAPTSNARGVVASADGSRMFAVGLDITGVYSSSDSGRTWGQVSGSQLSGSYVAVACSANGKIVYAEPGSGNIAKSADGGTTWVSAGVAGNGAAISCTADGSQILVGAACSGSGTYRARIVSGVISYSNNGGASWNNVTGPAGGVGTVGVSSDCTRMVAAISNGLLYASSNLGATWTSIAASSRPWSGVWISPDGSQLAATVITSGSTLGGIYNCNFVPLANTISSNNICGSQGSAVELQYIGNNQFMPVSSTGVLWAN